jgi:RimJ/RimL family protein N-acetyltransferase
MDAVLPALRGPRVILRAVEARDRATIARLPLEPDIGRFFGEELPERRPRTEDEVEELYGWLADDDEPFHWVVALDGEFIGVARFHHFWEDQPRARFAIGLHDAARLGQGLGTEAARLALAFGFEVLGLHRIDLRVMSHNERAIASYLKCGFREEGRERDSAFLEGRWIDDLIMSVLEDEYRMLAPGWPEWPQLERIAREGDPALRLPRPDGA